MSEQLGFDLEAKKRDAALDLLEATRGQLIEEAKLIAEEIALRVGNVTAPEVLARLKQKYGGQPWFDSLDKRFMGPVFRSGWVRVGFVNKGSHKQPISVWRKMG